MLENLLQKNKHLKSVCFFIGLFIKNVYSKKTVRSTKRKLVLNDRFLLALYRYNGKLPATLLILFFLPFKQRPK